MDRGIKYKNRSRILMSMTVNLTIIRSLTVSVILVLVAIPSAFSADLVPIIITPIDMNCTWQATFGSYKNQLVENENGIFMAYYWLYNPRPW